MFLPFNSTHIPLRKHAISPVPTELSAHTYVDWGKIEMSTGPLYTHGAGACTLASFDFDGDAMFAHIYPGDVSPGVDQGNLEAYFLEKCLTAGYTPDEAQAIVVANDKDRLDQTVTTLHDLDVTVVGQRVLFPESVRSGVYLPGKGMLVWKTFNSALFSLTDANGRQSRDARPSGTLQYAR